MEIQLIFNEDMVKDLMPISSNVAGGYLHPAMFEAQEIGLRSIIGGGLLDKVKGLQSSGSWKSAPAVYAELKDRAAFYLVYQTICNLLPNVAYKVANIGVVSTSDDKLTNLPREDIDALIANYQARADYFRREFQVWLKDNASALPELDARNLETSASCPIWLGGPRGNNGGTGL